VIRDVLQDLGGRCAHEHRRDDTVLKPALREDALQHALRVRDPHAAQLTEIHSGTLDDPRLRERIGHDVEGVKFGAGVAGQRHRNVKSFE
jgi:hypothetical protein